MSSSPDQPDKNSIPDATPVGEDKRAEDTGAVDTEQPAPVTAQRKASAEAEPLSAPAAAAPAPPVTHQRPSTALGLFLVLLLLLTFANGGAVYTLWQGQAEQAEQLRSVAQAEQQSLALADTVEQTRTGLTMVASDLDRTTQDQRQKLANFTTDLEAAQQSIELLTTATQELRAKVEGGATAWRLDAVEQLLMTANERLLLAQDARGAEQALALADARLQAIADPSWIELRRILAEEMASLRAVPQVDVTAINLKLQALSDRAPSLPLAGHMQRDRQRADRAPAQVDTPAVTTAPWYERMWDKTRVAVLSLVTIRQNTTPTAPLLPPDLHGLLVQNLRLQLQAARTALLLRDAAQYDNALRTASDWVQRYLGTEDASVQAAVSTLAELRRIKISPTPPDISGSLRRLRQLRDQG